MPTPKKKEKVAELSEQLAQSKVAILADYRGLTVSEMTELRRRLREAGVELHVAKNTLTRLAAEKVGKKDLGGLLTGPTAIAFGKGDEVQAARSLVDYVRGTRTLLKLKGGVLGTQVLSPEQVMALAALPPRPQLVAQMLGGLQAPLAGLMGVLQGNIRSLAGVLEARRKQMEESGSAAVPAGAS